MKSKLFTLLLFTLTLSFNTSAQDILHSTIPDDWMHVTLWEKNNGVCESQDDGVRYVWGNSRAYDAYYIENTTQGKLTTLVMYEDGEMDGSVYYKTLAFCEPTQSGIKK